jgi:hypothetical protein
VTADILPDARRRAAERKLQYLLPSLEGEEKPLLLLGGDEITLSVPHAFEVLGLVPTIVNFLQTKANSRVAVTRTGNVNGARGHERAMNAAETAHKILKSYEEIGRDLDLRSRRWVPSSERMLARSSLSWKASTRSRNTATRSSVTWVENGRRASSIITWRPQRHS